MTRVRGLALGLICLGLSTGAAAPAKRAWRLDFKDQRLKNGLRVVLAEDHAAPTYSISVAYNVGSRDERGAAPASPTSSST